jgi:penicillin-binding protein 1A
MRKQILIICLCTCCFLIKPLGLIHAGDPTSPDSLHTLFFLESLADYRPSLTSTVYAKDGSVLAYFYRENRFFITLEALPTYLKQAFIAAEDSHFYTHDGVDPHAVFRAFSNNVKKSAWRQGGSTITQQVIKRLLLSSDKSYIRKFKEAVLAYHLEKHLTKEDILTIYLNDIYFGAGAYGLEAAARTYFNKHAHGLSLAEAALLAGLLKAPSKLNPNHAPTKARTRQRYVLDRMLAEKFISKAQYQQALTSPLNYKRMHDPSWKQGSYYLAEVRRWLLNHLSREKMNARGISLPNYGADALYEGGLHIYTAFDHNHQQPAQKALSRGLEQLTLDWENTIPLNQIDTTNMNSFIAGQEKKPSIFHFQKQEWVKALIVECDTQKATVRVGKYNGTINQITGIWRRNPAYPLPPKDNPMARSGFMALLMPGDVVNARVLKVSPTGLVLTLAPRPRVQGALLSMDPETGEVKALVGGYDYKFSQFNRVTQAQRQSGSLFKPVVFSAALAQDYTAASMIMDAPLFIRLSTTQKIWQPKNFSGKYRGPTLLRTAMTQSINVVTARLAHQIGISKIIQQARQMGLKSGLPHVPSVSLGAGETNLMELVQAYSTFPRGGTQIEPRLVLSVYDRDFQLIFNNPPRVEQAMSPQNAYIITHLLKQSVENGTGWRARALNHPVAGKTGTTNDMRDAWFMGFTPYLLTGVFVGFDDGSSMGKLGSGAKAAVPIWLDYHRAVKSHYRMQEFEIPTDIRFGSVTNDGTYLGDGWYDKGIVLAFKKGTEPKRSENKETLPFIFP